MRNDFSAAATNFGYPFYYGRPDFLNLIKDMPIDQVCIYMEPPTKIEPRITATGAKLGETVTGKFMMLEKSSMDRTYDVSLNQNGVTENGKYQEHIEPMIPLLESFMAHLENCGQGWSITYSYIEAINLTDEGGDGLLVSYTSKNFE